MTEAKTESNGRDTQGRFTLGNISGRGRPRREREKEFLAAFDRALPAHELSEIVAAILIKAKEGSIPAARLLLEYAIGKPTERFGFENDHEFRVAGMSPRQNMEKMQQHIADRVQEMRAAEEERGKQ